MRFPRADVRLWLALAGAGVASCGLALGIDDVPPVPRRDAAPPSDAAGPRDAPNGRDAFGFRDASDARSDVVDAKPDQHASDAAPEAAVGQLPPRSGPQTTSDASVNFALHELWLGETDKTNAFTIDPSAWETFGYNIDGKVTTATSTDVCTLAATAPATAQTDGHEGADNSFGENLVGDFSIAFGGNFSESLSTRLVAGDFTVLFDTTGLSSIPNQTNIGLTARLFGGARFPGTPTFTLADNWPVDPDTLADGHLLSNGAKVSFSSAYIANGTWVSGQPTDIVFSVEIGSEPLVLIMHQAVATFTPVTDDAGQGHATNGMIAGILKAGELYGSLGSILGGVSGGAYCDLLPVFRSKLLAAQDIMEDGTNAPGEACNGISIGVAFEADQIQLPSLVAAPPTHDGGNVSCPFDAGAVDAGGADSDGG